MTRLEHANITVRNIDATSAWMQDIFGWQVRWDGEGMAGAGRTQHIGGPDSYLALYTPKTAINDPIDNYSTANGLNHLAVVVDDLDRVLARVQAKGFEVSIPEPYEPGRRFYFFAEEGLEFEVVQYD